MTDSIDEILESARASGSLRRHRWIPWAIGGAFVIALAVIARITYVALFPGPEVPVIYGDSYPAPHTAIELNADGLAVLRFPPTAPRDGRCDPQSAATASPEVINGTWRRSGRDVIEVTSDAGVLYFARANYRTGAITPEWDRLNLDACSAEGVVTSIPLWSQSSP